MRDLNPQTYTSSSRPLIDDVGLFTNKVAVRRREEEHGADKVFGCHSTLEGSRLSRLLDVVFDIQELSPDSSSGSRFRMNAASTPATIAQKAELMPNMLRLEAPISRANPAARVCSD